jgi:transposase InsO family protein
LYKNKTSRYWINTRCTRVKQKRYGADTIEKIRQLKVAVPARTAVTIYRLLKADMKESCPSKETIRRALKTLGFAHDESPGRKSYVKFERDFPNELWQIYFKGYEFFEHLGKLYPLAIMDNRSRFVVAARWCTDQEETNVLLLLREAFEKQGLPNEILSDNGTQFKIVVGEPATRYHRLLVRLDVKPVYHRNFARAIKPLFELCEDRFMKKHQI